MPYPLKHKTISWVSKTLFDNLTYTVRNGLNKGMRRRGGLGWFPVEHPTPELLFWMALDLRGKVVYDIGAFHGLLTMYFASSAKHVVAWEPNSRNRRRLEENIRLNSFSNVTIRPFGLSSEPHLAEMHFDSLVPGTASVDSRIATGAESERIELRVLDAEKNLPAPDLIKIDVEGFELEVLKGAARTLSRFPDLFLEMHGADPEDKQRRVAAIVDHLSSAGYSYLIHVESNTQITHENSAKAAEGHLYVRRGSLT